ncbi:MAG: type II toxin-antitoxin system RelE/ParE family toxin [Carboxylicivirga sp.]|nr:type II toxin-antitoxin system RelE/ParE family toxin [Carboxylicivirga sp.]
MEYKIEYTNEALVELFYAIKWYRLIDLDLEEKFNQEILKTFENIKYNPFIYTQSTPNQRRAIIGKIFPYSIHYMINGNHITILGIIHHSKNLDVLKDRILIEELKNEFAFSQIDLRTRLKELERIRNKQQNHSKDKDLDL